jgi:hypothetical protein
MGGVKPGCYLKKKAKDGVPDAWGARPLLLSNKALLGIAGPVVPNLVV